MAYAHYIEQALQKNSYKKGSVKMQEQETKHKKIDKSRLAIKIVASFLALVFILSVVASAIYYIVALNNQ